MLAWSYKSSGHFGPGAVDKCVAPEIFVLSDMMHLLFLMPELGQVLTLPSAWENCHASKRCRDKDELAEDLFGSRVLVWTDESLNFAYLLYS